MRLQSRAIFIGILLVLSSCAPTRPEVRHIVAVSTTAPPVVDTTTTTTAAPAKPRPKGLGARPSRGSQPRPDRDALLARIAGCEGYPDHVYSDHPGPSSATGKYGVLHGTWDGYAGYEDAKDAPESVQDQWAREAYAKEGTKPWAASRSCWGR